MVQNVVELPNLENTSNLYLDFETTSGDPKLDSLNPWFHCSIAGIAIGNEKSSWYIPVGHNDVRWNLDKDVVFKWLTQILLTCEEWVNHNIKYDAHVAANSKLPIPARLVDTLTLAKLVNSDRYRYGLKYLGKDENFKTCV